MSNPDVTPKVAAPWDACVGCYRGDTETGFAAVGEAEFIIAALHKAAGLPLDEATAMFDLFAEDELGCDPGTVPTGQVTLTFRLCRDCAERTGVKVATIVEGAERAPSATRLRVVLSNQTTSRRVAPAWPLAPQSRSGSGLASPALDDGEVALGDAARARAK